jgi:hypothetical protein
MSILGGDLSLLSVVKAMADNERSWEAVVSFSESVMSQEATERVREANAHANLIRRKRLGGRRRFGLLLPID